LTQFGDSAQIKMHPFMILKHWKIVEILPCAKICTHGQGYVSFCLRVLFGLISQRWKV